MACMTATLKILGSGNSSGVPSIGNNWGACDPDEPKNRRTRPCAALQANGKTVIIDTGPDFKDQYNASGLPRVDAVFYTHAHSDHVLGMNELRILCFRQGHKIPVYGTESTLESAQRLLPYMFLGTADGLYEPVVESRYLKNGDMNKPFDLAGFPVTLFEQDHGSCETIGLRIGDCGFSPDMIRLDQKALDVLKGVKTWFVDASGYKSDNNPVHANLEQVYAMNEYIGAEQVYLIHLTPGMDYKTLCAELKPGYSPAWDGLEVPVDF